MAGDFQARTSDLFLLQGFPEVGTAPARGNFVGLVAWSLPSAQPLAMGTSPKWCYFPHLHPVSPRSVHRVTPVRKISMRNWEDFSADQWALYALLLGSTSSSLLLKTYKNSRIISSFFILGISSTPSGGENSSKQGSHNHMIIMALMNRRFIPRGPCDVQFMDAKKNRMTKWNHKWTMHFTLGLSKRTETVNHSQDCDNKRMHMKGGNMPAYCNCEITMPHSSTWISYSDCCSHVRAQFRPLHE